VGSCLFAKPLLNNLLVKNLFPSSWYCPLACIEVATQQRIYTLQYFSWQVQQRSLYIKIYKGRFFPKIGTRALKSTDLDTIYMNDDSLISNIELLRCSELQPMHLSHLPPSEENCGTRDGGRILHFNYIENLRSNIILHKNVNLSWFNTFIVSQYYILASCTLVYPIIPKNFNHIF
jgi:hypothetical protein